MDATRAVLAEHVDAALTEVERRIEANADRYVGNVFRIVRDYREEIRTASLPDDTDDNDSVTPK